MAMPLMCCGADMHCVPSRKQVVVVGDKASEEFDKMLAAAHSSYNPNKTVCNKKCCDSFYRTVLFILSLRDEFCVWTRKHR